MKKIEFLLSKFIKNHSFGDRCCKTDVIDHYVKECSFESLPTNGLEACIIGSVYARRKNEESNAYKKLLDESPIDKD